MKLLIVNGPNLNLLGKREPSVYGTQNFEAYFQQLKKDHPDVDLTYYQSNVEGELINCLQASENTFDGILFNAGGYTHTSVAIRDAIAAIDTPVLEIHISNIAERESFRHESLMSPVCCGAIMGMGLFGYDLGIHYFVQKKD